MNDENKIDKTNITNKKDKNEQKLKKIKKKIAVGGVALYNGIMFTSEYRQAHVTQEKYGIYCDVIQMKKSKNILYKIPIIRGILSIGNQLGNSAPTFNASLDLIDEDGSESKKNNKKLKDSEGLTTIISYIFMIILMILIPVAISALFKNHIAQNIVQLLGIVLEILAYVVLLKLVPELNQIFSYHGAEHKVVNAYENLEIEDITLENVKRQTRIHKRCGGNLVMHFIYLTLLTILIPEVDLMQKAIYMIGLSVLNIGIAYELVTILSKLPKPLDVLNYPASVIQLVTIKEPTDDMLKLAMYGVLSTVREKNGVSVQDYIIKYTKENREKILNEKHKEIDVQDIYRVIELVLNIDKNKLQLEKNDLLISINKEIRLDELLNKYYYTDYPLQYITHKEFFYNEEYYVDENVLIPRSDTEILVEKAIEYINKEELKTCIDLCTGSGAIGISIAKNSNIERVDLIDLSQGAISVARKNISLNHTNNVIARISDLLNVKIAAIKDEEEKREKLKEKVQTEGTEQIDNTEENIKEPTIWDTDGKVDIIVSNPPYIRKDVIPSLDKEVQKEPHMALDGGKDGLDFYRKIIEQAKIVLKPNGLLMFEIGYDQLKDMKTLISQNEEYELLESVKDYGGNDRVVICRFQHK